MAKKQLPKKKYPGTNIRFKDEAHITIKNFCDKNGYNIGAFCEIAALEKIKSIK
jgi:hypothetical protein